MNAKTIYAAKQKGKQTFLTTFSPFQWGLLPKGKNGWQEVTEEEHTKLHAALKEGSEVSLPKTKEVDLSKVPQTELKVKMAQLKANAEGFENDGEYAKALDKYLELQKLKNSTYVQNRIKEVNVKIAGANIETKRTEADTLFNAGDFSGALALYGEIAKTHGSDEISDLIKQCEDKIESA